MTGLGASERIKLAMTKHGILWAEVSARIRHDEKCEAWRAEEAVARFRNGGPCAVVVAAAIISIIVDKQRVPA